MSTTRSACQPHWIDDFWRDGLSGDQLQRFEQHLASCELCQSHFDEAMKSQYLMDTLSDSREQLVNTAGHRPAVKAGASVDQHESLRSLARRLFPATATSSITAGLSAEAEVLGTIDHFDLLEPIGSGGMGFVYKAYDRKLHRLVALKVLSPSVATTGASRQRFTREAQAAANIASPHVVPIHAVSQFEGLPYLVMSLVDGPDLQTWITEHGMLPILDSLRIASQVAEGLCAAHEKGVVHRDVKPANILFQPSILHASLTDFGLALVADEMSLTHSGIAPGTPSFMSPEQAKGETIDQRSDWYSFGCVLYSMLVGHPPFRGPHAMSVLSKLQSESPKPPSSLRPEIPQWLDRLVLRLLDRKVDTRLGDGPTIVTLLKACVAHLEAPKHHDLPIELLVTRRFSVSKLGYLALAAVCLVVCSWTLIAFWPSEIGTIRKPISDGPPGTPLSGEATSEESKQRMAVEAEVQLRLNEFKAVENAIEGQLNDLELELRMMEVEP